MSPKFLCREYSWINSRTVSKHFKDLKMQLNGEDLTLNLIDLVWFWFAFALLDMQSKTFRMNE